MSLSEMDRDAKLWMMNELYGIETIPPEEDYETYVKATLICAKGDGVLSPEERAWIVGRAAVLRNPWYDFAKTYSADENLLDVIAKAQNVDQNGRRVIIYAAIKACGADGEYNQEEQQKVSDLANLLGVDLETVGQIEQLCREEARIREERIALMFPNGIPY